MRGRFAIVVLTLLASCAGPSAARAASGGGASSPSPLPSPSPPPPPPAGSEVIEYYAYDAQGSVRTVFTPAGVVVGQATYTPYGQETWGTSGMPSRRFTGHEHDQEAGLDNFNARAYALRLGRFSRPDPILGASANPQSWNRYSYGLNNPLSYGDPTGLSPCFVLDAMPDFCAPPPMPQWPDGPWYPGPLDPCDFNPDCGSGGGGGGSGPLPPDENPGPEDPPTCVVASMMGAGAAECGPPPGPPQPPQPPQPPTPPTPPTPVETVKTLRLPPGQNQSPIKGDPNSWMEIYDSKGNATLRRFGPNGNAAYEFDVGHDHGMGDPHGHWWDYANNTVERISLTLSNLLIVLRNTTVSPVIVVNPCITMPSICRAPVTVNEM